MQVSQQLFAFSSGPPVDTLNVTRPLTDGDTIVSAGGSYELGFFSPGVTWKRYLGIWYSKIPAQTVVWVANRDIPLNHSLGTLKVTSQGILVLMDHDGSIVWSSSNTSGPASNPVAQLLDSGNLVVKENDEANPENFLWQSFDHPCDTLLPGMKLGWNLETGLDRFLSSWKSPDDPSRGNFTMGFEVGGFPEEKLREGSIVRFRSGPWNGKRFSSTTGLKLNAIFTFEFVFNNEEIYYGFKLRNNSVPLRMVLNMNGLWQRLIWIHRKQTWDAYTTVQKDNCDNYGLCGAFGSCDIRSSPVCSCLKGFLPKYQAEWGSNRWSKGCFRKTQLNCLTDGFLKYSGVKLPDSGHSWFNYSISLEECQNLCIKNCSCTAYANLDIRSGGSGCLLWFVNHVDIRMFTEKGQEIYVRMAASDLDQSGSTKFKEKERLKFAVIISMISALLIIGLAFVMYRRRNTCRIIPRLLNFLNVNNSHVRSLEEDLDIPTFSIATIASATGNFSIENKLGEGGFGSVYKVTIL
ncbi:hypothetical protein V6N11_016727 [Hibiscus sabdariffa]|uniref:Uncharacterized protein n=1 Tax=Hibiscus sabdariffa TaxID=183260 RepID=A0ABR2TVU5_9ROSI